MILLIRETKEKTRVNYSHLHFIMILLIQNQKMLPNTRREFFNVTLDEIKEVVKNNFDKTVEFIEFPDADQYRTSLKMKEGINKSH